MNNNYQNLVPLFVDKSSGKHVATNRGNNGHGNDLGSAVILIEITDNGSHKHAAYINGDQAIDLIRGAIQSVDVNTTTADAHQHTITVGFTNGNFTVTNIADNHIHGFKVIGTGENTNTGGAAEGYRHSQPTPAQIWTVTHNHNSTNAITQVYVNDELVIPTRIRFIDINTIEIYFNEPVAGFSNTVFYTQV